MRSNQRTLFLWLMALVLMLVVFQVYETRRLQEARIDYPEFYALVEGGLVKSVTVRSSNKGGGSVGELRGEFVDSDKVREKYKTATKFRTLGDISSESVKALLLKNGVVPKYEYAESMLGSVFLQWLPLILIAAMFFFLFRQIQIGGGRAMNFGKSRARLLVENKKKVSFKDVAGVDEAKEELKEIVQFLKSPKKFTRLGGRIPKGVLLVGPPGTGKTLLARAVAGEASVPFFSISGSDFVEMFVGVGASRVRDLFEQAKRQAPCLVFVDEIDAVGRHRGAGMGGGHDEREQTLNQLLVEMDGFSSNEGVILIAATNRPDVLDSALLRPGRFDRRVMVQAPDLEGRKKILAVHTRATPLASDVDLAKLARGTPGFSGADLESLINEAALIAARFEKHKIEMSDLEKAKDKVLMGSERRSMVLSEKDKKITAYHEAGHTLVGKFLSDLDPVHKVSIMPRGMALGVTQTLPKEDMLNMSLTKATNTIAFLFGGRAAEEIVFKDFTTGASNDIERATKLARSMVCEWGMSDKVGPLMVERSQGQVFVGMQAGKGQVRHSDAFAKLVDDEVLRLIREGRKVAMDLLQKHIKHLHALSEALLEYETLDAKEVDLILEGGGIKEILEARSRAGGALKKEQAEAKRLREEKEAKEAKEAQKKSSLPSPGEGVKLPV